jgi:hypothetical protein
MLVRDNFILIASAQSSCRRFTDHGRQRHQSVCAGEKRKPSQLSIVLVMDGRLKETLPKGKPRLWFKGPTNSVRDERLAQGGSPKRRKDGRLRMNQKDLGGV